MDSQEYFKLHPEEAARFALNRKAAKDFRTQYYRDHECCPACGWDKTGQTYVGYIVVINEDGTIQPGYKDSNHCYCGRCDWVGIVDDLVAKKES